MVHKNAMIGDDSRRRARAHGRHGAQERHDWGQLARARAGVTVNKNVMIGDVARASAHAYVGTDIRTYGRTDGRTDVT